MIGFIGGLALADGILCRRWRVRERGISPVTCCRSVVNAGRDEPEPERRVKLSLPTTRERWGCFRAGVRRESNRPVGSSDAQLAFRAKCWRLQYSTKRSYPVRPRISSVYWVHIVCSKAVMGKRAVHRTNAKRKVREALRLLMPIHAVRAREYIFYVQPEIRGMSHAEIVAEAEAALKQMSCWEEELPPEAFDRPFYSKVAIKTVNRDDPREEQKRKIATDSNNDDNEESKKSLLDPGASSAQ
uniref:Uncharacterized protein n=1 Tax=Rhodosorus marinus TaxID=101924 RepID=A0A7S0BHX3_9RHOD|mmetsp:Transcript_15870/g.23193  ORF Transcript_15870/g.23193 Transcript_15870/m.23193 type:complete len:243 (+) Transcript_15870:107-835(+)